jgi:hypothetical protein
MEAQLFLHPWIRNIFYMSGIVPPEWCENQDKDFSAGIRVSAGHCVLHSRYYWIAASFSLPDWLILYCRRPLFEQNARDE